MRTVMNKNALAAFLALVFMVLSIAPASSGYHLRFWRHHRPHHHSETAGALVGGAGGALVGGLAGGGKGALIGGAAGAGTGWAVQRYRNRHHRHKYYTYRR